MLRISTTHFLKKSIRSFSIKVIKNRGECSAEVTKSIAAKVIAIDYYFVGNFVENVKMMEAQVSY